MGQLTNPAVLRATVVCLAALMGGIYYNSHVHHRPSNHVAFHTTTLTPTQITLTPTPTQNDDRDWWFIAIAGYSIAGYSISATHGPFRTLEQCDTFRKRIGMSVKIHHRSGWKATECWYS
jgi:hypothetical protein